MNIKFLTLILFIFLTSCQKNDTAPLHENDKCGLINAENQFLTEESNSYFLYEGFEKIIFIDENSNEYEFSIMHSETVKETFQKYALCGDKYENINFKRELKKVTLIGPEQGDHRIVIKLTTGFHLNETNFNKDHLIDILSISQYRIPEGGGGSIITQHYITSNRGGIVNLELANDGYNELENFEALGLNFGSVIESKTSFNTWEPIYYSKTQGIVALNNIAHIFLVFDRFE